MEVLSVVIPELAESGDERVRKRLIERLSHLETDCPECIEEEIAYLERQKEHLTPTESYMKGFSEGVEAQKEVEQKPAEWNEEDEELAEELIKLAEYYTDTEDETEFKPHISWLKALPERFNLQPKQEWSEEDEVMLSSAIEYVQSYPAHRQSVVSWLQGKLKSLRPQPHWKPSEEQINALQMVKDSHYFMYQKDRVAIEKLLEQIKTL